MTRLFTTGAEEGDIAAVWDSAYTKVLTNLDTHDIKPRTGWACYQLGADNYSLVKYFSGQPTELYVGFAFYADTYGSTNLLQDTSNGLNIFPAANGVLQIRRATTVVASSGSGALPLNQWCYVEIYFYPKNSGGECTVKVNGVQVVTYTGDTTNSNEYMSGLEFFGETDGTVHRLLDDIVINDAIGTVNNSWPGQVRLLPIMPQAAGDNTGWSRAGVDLGANWLQVAQQGDMGEFSVLETSTPDTYDLYAPPVPDMPAGATIKNIVVKAIANIENGSGGLALLCQSGSTLDEGANQSLSPGYLAYEEAWAVNPDDSAGWDEQDLASLQIGIKAKS
jgi:hypothetical protein